MYQIGHKKTTKWWAILLVIFCLLIFLYFVGGLNWTVAIFTRTFSSAQGGLYQAGNLISNIKSKGELIKENEDLTQRLQQLALDVSQLEILEAENQTLHKQLNFLEGKPYHFVTARVISQSAQENISALVINQGSDAGIVIGAPVIAGEGVLVGKIIEVKKDISILLLLTDKQSKVAATIQNKDQTIGVVEGEHGISVKMEKIPRDEEIKAGDTIVTSGLEEGVPQGLLIGLVDRVDLASSELFARAYIYPLVDYHKLNIVSVILP